MTIYLCLCLLLLLCPSYSPAPPCVPAARTTQTRQLVAALQLLSVRLLLLEFLHARVAADREAAAKAKSAPQVLQCKCSVSGRRERDGWMVMKGL